EFTDKTQKPIDDTYAGIKKDTDNFIKNEQNIIIKHIKASKANLPKYQANAENQLKDLNSRYSSELQNIDEKVNDFVSNSQDALETIKKLFISDLTDEYRKILASVETGTFDTPEKAKQAYTTSLKKMTDSLEKKQQLTEKEMANSKKELEEKIAGTFKKDLTDMTSRKEKFFSFIEKSTQDYFRSFDNHVNEIDKGTNEQFDKTINKIQKAFDKAYSKVKNDYKGFIKDQYKLTDVHLKELQGELKNFRKDADKQINDIKKLLSPELSRLEKNVNKFAEDIRSLIATLDEVIISGIPDNLRSNINNTQKTLETNSQNAKNSIETFKSQWLTTSDTRRAKLNEINMQNKENHLSSINELEQKDTNALDEICSQMKEFTSTMHDRATTQTQIDQENFQNLIVTVGHTLKDSFNKIIQEQRDQFKKIEDIKNDMYTSQDTQIQEHYQQMHTYLNEKITNYEQMSNNKISYRKEELKTLHEDAQNQISSDNTSTKEKYVSEINTTYQKFHDSYGQLHTDLKGITIQFLEKAEKDNTDFLMESRDDTINRYRKNVDILRNKTKYMGTIYDQYSGSIKSAMVTANSLRDGLIQKLNDHYEIITTGTANFAQGLQTTVTSGLEVLKPRITILEDLERIVTEYKYPRITSFPVIGRGQALNTINEYLGDFKASVTLLIPNPKEIPVESILNTKRPKRVTVASMFDLDLPDEKEIVKKLVELDNVTVRRLEPEQYRGAGGGYPAYLSAERDAEETFFGAYDTENKAEFAGMVSQNQSYIDFIGKVVLSDFITRAKKLDRNSV
ncbi:MAG: hypothetical protein ACFFD1_10475, partial [Candidatus Thorarchaeota archaeon]